VLDDGEHVLLCGEAAWAFARERGFSRDAGGELYTERARRRIEEERARRAAAAAPQPDPGTVGACAIDATGATAAATSTGGTSYKRIGRVGDTPLAGCGTYADDRGGAASATGEGEGIVRVTMTRTCVELMRAGATAAEAARAAVAELGERVGGHGGVICCDRAGGLGAAHNTQAMPHATAVLGPGGRPAIRAAISAAGAGGDD
jgi:L-asparaginase / beta-aspartyl-peptidase